MDPFPYHDEMNIWLCWYYFIIMKLIYDYADDILWSWLYEKGKVDKYPPGRVDGEGGGV